MKTSIILVLAIFIFSLISCGKSGKEDCDEKGTPWKWDAEQKRCMNPNSPDGDTEDGIIFTNAYADIVNVESGSQSIDLAKGECVKIYQDHLDKLKIRKFGVLSSSSTTSVGPVCDNSDAKTDNDCPFNTNKDYKIVAKPDGPASWAIQEVDKGDGDSTNCKILPKETTSTDTGQTSLKLEPDETTITNFLIENWATVKVVKVAYQHGDERPDFDSTPGIILEPAINKNTPAANGAGCIILKHSQLPILDTYRGGFASTEVVYILISNKANNDARNKSLALNQERVNQWRYRHWGIVRDVHNFYHLPGIDTDINRRNNITTCAHRLQ